MELTSLQGLGRRLPDAVCFHRARLCPQEREIYDRVCEAICKKQTNVTIIGPKRGSYERILEAVKRDQPLMYYVDFRQTTRVFTDRWTRLTWNLHIPPVQIAGYDARILARLAHFRRRGATGEARAQAALHDGLLQSGVRPVRSGPGTWEDHCIVGPLLEGHTVCEGMAMLFYLLCALHDIPCMVIGGRGKKEAHAWNLSRIGGRWAHVDAYWNLCIGGDAGAPRRDYLNLSDEMARRDHSWDGAAYPACPAAK